METIKAKYNAQGFGVCAISYDSPAILKHFAERRRITYPLLSDPESKIIRAFGIFNTTMQRGAIGYGVPFPGTYLVDQHGIVQAKYFEDVYQDRFTAGDILVRQFNASIRGGETTVETPHLQLKYALSDEAASAGNRVALVIEIAMKRKVHVYAPQVKKDYIPLSWSMEPTTAIKDLGVSFPPPKILYMRPIKERLPVYQGELKLVREVRLAEDKILRELVGSTGQVLLRGELKYQACDDRVCYLPETIPLTWTLKIRSLDRERVPADIQHKPAPGRSDKITPPASEPAEKWR